MWLMLCWHISSQRSNTSRFAADSAFQAGQRPQSNCSMCVRACYHCQVGHGFLGSNTDCSYALHNTQLVCVQHQTTHDKTRWNLFNSVAEYIAHPVHAASPAHPPISTCSICKGKSTNLSFLAGPMFCSLWPCLACFRSIGATAGLFGGGPPNLQTSPRTDPQHPPAAPATPRHTQASP